MGGSDVSARALPGPAVLLVHFHVSLAGSSDCEDGPRDAGQRRERRGAYMRVRSPVSLALRHTDRALPTAVTAGTFTAIHALLRGSRHPSPLALSSAVNGGIAGAIFFSALCALCSSLTYSRRLHMCSRCA